MSAKGTSTFIMQRATSVLLLPLTLWLVWSLVRLAASGAGYEEMRAWASSPLNAVAMAAFIVISAAHMRIGLAEVIEDYIHSGMKGLLMTLNWLAALGVAGGGLYAAYLLAFAG